MLHITSVVIDTVQHTVAASLVRDSADASGRTAGRFPRGLLDLLRLLIGIPGFS
jgi:hypothetical protein